MYERTEWLFRGKQGKCNLFHLFQAPLTYLHQILQLIYRVSLFTCCVRLVKYETGYSPVLTSWHVINNTWAKQIPSHTGILRWWAAVIFTTRRRRPCPCLPQEVEYEKITASPYAPQDAHSTRERSCQPLRRRSCMKLQAACAPPPCGSPASHLAGAKITLVSSLL